MSTFIGNIMLLMYKQKAYNETSISSIAIESDEFVSITSAKTMCHEQNLGQCTQTHTRARIVSIPLQREVVRSIYIQKNVYD